MDRQYLAEETSTIFHSIIHARLVHSDWDWMPQFRFEEQVERAFLRYYRIWSHHWKLVASILFGVFLLLQLVVAVTIAMPLMPVDLLLGLVFQFTLLITLVLRIRVRYTLPLMLMIISAALFGLLHLFQHSIPIQYVFQVVTVAMVGLLLSILLEYDARRDFLGQARMHRIATTDLLSQTLSRHAFFERGTLELKRAQRYQNQLSLLLIDIDHFKNINDKYGHLTGDRVIAQLGEQLQLHLRPYDLVGRIGGEEFAILLPNTHTEAATQIAERLRHLASQINAKEPMNVTVSIGVALMEASDQALQDLIGRADTCLYMAKHAGRNRVVFQPTAALGHPAVLQVNA